MAASAAFARIKSDVLDIVARIPPGRVAIHKTIGQHLAVEPRHVAYILATLEEADRAAHPWWRVVADGGAIGRHLRRDDQMARLRTDGVVLSPVGIVQDLDERRIDDIPALVRGPRRPINEPPPREAEVKPSRSRGMKGKPTSTV